MENPKILVAIPMLNTINAQFFTSVLALQGVGNTKLAVEVGSLVYMARNKLAEKAIEGGYDYILWMDSDMVFPPDVLRKLLADAEHGKDYVSALYFKRNFPIEPVICKRVVWERDEETGVITHGAELYHDYKRDSIFRIGGSGLGMCLMKTDLLKEVAMKFASPPFDPLPSMGEDYSLCWRLNQLGKKMWCDSRIKCGHVGTMVYDEEIYLQQVPEDEEAK